MEKKQTRFDAWWATLTPAEQKVIGRTNAKFVWLEACEACAKVADEYAGCEITRAKIADNIRERNNP